MVDKTIDTLVEDIKARIVSNEPIPEEEARAFGQKLGEFIASRLSRGSDTPRLRVSNLGTPCDRKLWYSINRSDLAEPLTASTRLKFLIGDLWEQVLLFLAKQSGHRVEDEQREVEINGVRGSLDARIDGVVVDVKSASPFSFRKFREGLTADADAFGYLTQLGAYASAVGSRVGAFLVGEKVLGNITLDKHDLPDVDYTVVVDDKRDMLSWPQPPQRAYKEEAETYYRKPTGNFKLSVPCSYCGFKSECWPKLRVFVKNGRPVFYTKVVNTSGEEITLEEAQEAE